MKKTMRYLSMAALALVGAMMTGCSSDDFEAQPAKSDNVVTLTTTVDFESSAATRALDADGIKTFGEGETMAILYKNTSGNFVKAVSEALTDGNITSGGKSATFTFNLENPDKTYPVEYVYPASMLTDGGLTNEDALSNEQDGTLATLASKFDYCSAMDDWVGDNLPSLTLTNRLAILAITLKDNAATPNDITSTITGMTLSDGTYNYSVTRTAAAGPIYVAIRPTFSADISYTATDGTHYYVKEVTSKTYATNHLYPLGLRMGTSNTINLARLSANYTAQDGQTLTGTLGANVKISIANNATVTLDDATINGENNDSYNWAGITCLGDATIVLEGTNTVKGFYDSYPGVYVPTGKTLTIQGTGSLNASSNGYAAGIGGGYEISCGNIAIEGGTITATGGSDAAGIGSRDLSCGTITISGGNVTATAKAGSHGAGIGAGAGGSCGNITISGGTVSATGDGYGAGIGSGRTGTCNDITITNGVTRVTAIKGGDATYSIGAGNGGTCGTVTIGGVVGAISTSPYTYLSPLLSGQFTINGSGDKVQFSRGNLQAVCASADADGSTQETWIWQFASNQYEVGTANSAINGDGSVSTAGTVDLFCWSTSATYYGISTIIDNTGLQGAFVDWGGNIGSGWYTLSKEEWDYLFSGRTNAASKYGHGSVNGVNGMIILPDSWTLPDGLSFTSGNSSWTNSYTTVQWSQMESSGAVHRYGCLCCW